MEIFNSGKISEFTPAHPTSHTLQVGRAGYVLCGEKRCLGRVEDEREEKGTSNVAERRKENVGWRKEEGGVCVWRVWRPLRRAGGGCQATPFNPHILTPPSTNPKTPLWAHPPSPHGALFLSRLSGTAFAEHGSLLDNLHADFNSGLLWSTVFRIRER